MTEGVGFCKHISEMLTNGLTCITLCRLSMGPFSYFPGDCRHCVEEEREHKEAL